MDKINIMRSSFLFRGLNDDEFEACIKEVSRDIERYSKGDTIFDPGAFDRKIGFVISGEATVGRTKSCGDVIPLNSLKKGDAFGVLAVFNGREEFPTVISARKDCEILFVSREELDRMMRISHKLTINLIEFLANRIGFLCDKISSFSSDNVEQKLARYLFSLYKESGSTELKFNKKHAAESLNTGRTSLYRSLESLVECGIIEIKEKQIYIIDPKGLERITK